MAAVCGETVQAALWLGSWWPDDWSRLLLLWETGKVASTISTIELLSTLEGKMCMQNAGQKL